MPIANSVTVENGSVNVVGYLTSFVAAEGDTFLLNGQSYEIAFRESSHRLRLRKPYKGADLTDQIDWSITPTSKYWSTIVTVNKQITDLIQKIEAGLPIKPDATGNLARRATYDARPEGFIYLRTDTNPFVMHIKQSATAGDWTPGVSLTGPQGLQGPQGIQGIQGIQGPATTITIGTVTSGAAGTAAVATMSGTAPNQVLHLTIPRGNTGIQGIQGPVGPANQLKLGTVTTAATGADAAVTLTGTAGDQTVSFVLPRGAAGLNGRLAEFRGNDATETLEWRLQGDTSWLPLTGYATIRSAASGGAGSVAVTPYGSMTETNVQAALQGLIDRKLDVAQKAIAGGIASLDGTGKVPAAQLPSFATALAALTDVSFASPQIDDIVGFDGTRWTNRRIQAGITVRLNGSPVNGADAAVTDMVPDAFQFPSASGAELSTAYTSDPMPITGTNAPSPVSVTGGTWSKNGGAFSATAGTVNPGDTVQVRGTSSGSNSTGTTVSLNVNGVIANYVITTKAATAPTADTTPNAFTITDTPNASLSTLYTSPTVTIGGINAPTPISVTGGTHSINGAAFTSANGTVNNGDNVRWQTTSSDTAATAVNVVANIGGVTDTWTVTTAAAQTVDTTPNDYSLNDQTNVQPGIEVLSNIVTISGLGEGVNAPIEIDFTTGSGERFYRINGGAWVTTPGTIKNGDTLQGRVISSTTLGGVVNLRIRIGDDIDSFMVTTTTTATQPTEPTPTEPTNPTPVTPGNGTVNMPSFTSGPWKTTLPVDASGRTYATSTTVGVADEYWPSDGLASLDNPAYHDRQSDGSIIFRAPLLGATTSGTKYSRSELRQILADGSNEYDWRTDLGGRLECSLAVLALPTVTVGSASNSRVVIGQIHGPSDEPCRLYYWTAGHLTFVDDKAGAGTSGSETTFFLTSDGTQTGPRPNIPLGKIFTYVIEMDMSGIRVTATVDGVKYWNFSPRSNFWAGSVLQYFKAGVYNAVGRDTAGGDATTRGTGESAARFYRILNPKHPHTITSTSGDPTTGAYTTPRGATRFGATWTADTPARVINFGSGLNVTETADGEYTVVATATGGGGSTGGTVTAGPDVIADVVAGGTTDQGPKIQAAIDSAASNGGGKVIVQAPTTGEVYLNSKVGLKSNITLEVRSPMLFGTSGQIQAQGALSTTTTTISANTIPGARTITVASSSGFTPGDLILIDDNKIGTDVSGSSSNKINVELNEIASISGTTITLQKPVNLVYATTFAAKITKVNPLHKAVIRGVRMRFQATPTATSMYTLSLKYCVDSGIEDCEVLGNAATGIGSSAQAIRLEGAYRSYIRNCAVYRPSEALSGEGYGISVYFGSRECHVYKNNLNGCRHSIILFQGVSDNLIEGNISTDCRGTDYDLHGANEINNTFKGNIAVGGPSTSDISGKAAFKIGNTTHRAGSHRNTFTDNEVRNYVGFMFHVVPSSTDNIMEGNIGQNCTGGFLLQRLTADLTLKVLRNVIKGNTMRRVGRPFHCDGGDATNLAVQFNSFHDNTMLDTPIADAPAVLLLYTTGIIASNNHIECLSEDNYIFSLNYNLATKFQNWYVQGGNLTAIQSIDSASAEFSDFKFASRATILSVLPGTGQNGFTLSNYEHYGIGTKFDLPLPGAYTIYSAEKRHAQAIDALVRPTNFAGTTAAVPFDDTEPLPAEMFALCEARIRPTQPRGRVAFEANIPMVVASASDNAVIAVYVYEGTSTVARLAGIATWRMTSGTTSGTGQSLVGSFVHGMTDLTQELRVELRLGVKTSTTTMTLGSLFGAAVRATLDIKEV